MLTVSATELLVAADAVTTDKLAGRFVIPRRSAMPAETAALLLVVLC
jgi:hypothetical protein